MPAINVARTDTFEQQRVKINEIGSQIFSITQGGSDLATGNLRIGDGTISSPSLAFASDNTVGIYKSSDKTLGFAADGKRLFNIANSSLYSYKDFFIQKNYLLNSDITITSVGSGYESGTYPNITLLGGSGDGATASVVVTAFTGSITNSGQNYLPGTFTSVELTGGSGSGATASFTITNILGSITSPGSLYGEIDSQTSVRTSFYSEVPLTGGSGSGATADFLLNPTTGSVDVVTFRSAGQNYVSGDVLGVNNADLGGVGSGFQIEVTQTPGELESLQFTAKGTGYQVGDILSLPLAISNISTTLDSASTDITVSSSAGIENGYLVEKVSGTGELAANTVVTSSFGNTISIYPQPTVSGPVVVNFVPPFGVGTTTFQYEINDIGTVESISIVEGGNGYNAQDTFTISPQDLIQPTEINVFVKSVHELSFTNTLPSGTFAAGDLVKQLDGSILSVFTTSSSTLLPEALNTYPNVATTTNGSGSGATFDVTRDAAGDPTSILLNQTGFQYQIGDTVTISGSLVGGSSPADDITLEVTGSSQNQFYEVFSVEESGGNTIAITTEFFLVSNGDFIVKSGSSTTYEINSFTGSENRFFLDTGSGEQISPSLTFYSGETYKFILTDSSVSGHPLSFSIFRDGVWSPSLVENVSTTLSLTSKEITVASTTNILAGMSVTVSSGDGRVSQTCLVESVDNSTTLTLSEFPSQGGAAVLSFAGVEYLNGVTRTSDYVSIRVTDSTPNLYYYCPNHPNMGGTDNNESLLTVDLNNPRTFGSGFSLFANSVTSLDLIEANSDTGLLTSQNIDTGNIDCSSINSSGQIVSTSLDTDVVYTERVDTSSTLEIFSANTKFNSNVSVGTNLTIASSSGNLTTSGVLKTTNALNINDNITVVDNTISSTTGKDINLSPASSRILKVQSSTALVIPVGTDAQRPTGSLAQDGAIRFNTVSGQYEGYNASTTSWSSLGGVRDIDGNTYILAELTTGANDNTLWFYNDNVNTLKLTPQFLDFRSVKKISSGRLGLPAFTLWSANTPVTIGNYIKYRNNLYEVTASGTTASSGNEPTHTSGVANNGTAQLTWYSSAVSPLEFTEVEELKVGPNKDCPLVVSSELKLFNNTISTLVEDLVLIPNTGKKVSINAATSLVIPVGNINQRGSASQGSIRFNTTISQFEGYSGTNWSSLGGVRDVDGNTYIIPETAPAANENILYFYNDNVNTLQVTTTELDFTNIDTITTSGGNSLALNTEIITLDNSATTIDNTDSTSTFISTTKQYLDLGLSAGLTVDPVLRLDDQGDVYLNTGFGTGSFNGVKIFDGDLKDFELADYAVKTNVLSLVKGTSNSGAVILYDTTTAKGCRVTVVSKSSAGKKSMVEYSIIDNGTDIFHNEFGSLNTSLDGFTAAFDITPGNETRITLTLSNDHATSDTVEITVLTQVVK